MGLPTFCREERHLPRPLDATRKVLDTQEEEGEEEEEEEEEEEKPGVVRRVATSMMMSTVITSTRKKNSLVLRKGRSITRGRTFERKAKKKQEIKP